MLRLPTRFAAVVLCFAPLFSHRSWRHAEVLLVGVSCTRFPWTAICPTGDRHGEVQYGREHA